MHTVLASNPPHVGAARSSWLQSLGTVATLLSLAGGAEAQATPPALTWAACADEPSLQCATLQVPLDYSKPAGATIGIALAKLPAANPAQRIGTLFINPGGPGDSGKQFLYGLAGSPELVFNADVRSRFDIVGFDPRFVGESGAIGCNTAAEYEKLFSKVAFVPWNADLQADAAKAYGELARQCAERSPQLQFAGTGNVARDLDLLRQAVGDAKLNFAGYSYGTLIAQVYAAMFPNNVRALIMDGVLDAESFSGSAADAGIPLRIRTASAEGAYTTFQELLRLCREAGPSKCQFAAGGDPATKFDELAEAAWNHAPTAFGDYYSDFIFRITKNVYNVSDWFVLTALLQREYDQLVSGIVTPDDDPSGGGEDTTPVDLPELPADTEPLLESGILGGDVDLDNRVLWMAVTCADAPNPTDPAVWAQYAAQQEEITPNFGYVWTYRDFGCAFWKLPASGAYRGPFATTTSPVLVINSRFDPATNHSAAAAVAARFPNAKLLTYEGWGHVASKVSNSCVQKATSNYLIDLTLPTAAACQPETRPFE